jgi:hypothetical protein
MWKAIQERPGSWYITYNDRVQPFGAIFFNERGDLGELVKRAVNRLNQGKRTVHGVRGLYEVVMQPSGIADIKLVRTPLCNKCDTPMKEGQALQNQLVGGTHRGATLNRTGPAQMVKVWKCPDCGHSVTK